MNITVLEVAAVDASIDDFAYGTKNPKVWLHFKSDKHGSSDVSIHLTRAQLSEMLVCIRENIEAGEGVGI